MKAYVGRKTLILVLMNFPHSSSIAHGEHLALGIFLIIK